MTMESLNQQVRAQQGKPGGWPAEFALSAAETVDSVEINVDASQTGDAAWKRVDPWGFAFLHEVRETSAAKPLRLNFFVGLPRPPKGPARYEALKRRLSYLAMANASNHLQVTLVREGSVDALYTKEELAQRPPTEVIRSRVNRVKRHSDKRAPGRLEKDFQAYLFGEGLYENAGADTPRTNERLALFGGDFFAVGKLASAKKEGGYKVAREFPTGAFSESVKEANRILPTEYVDLVTLNKWGDLALIEIKVDDPKLEVIPQVLNYALFFHCYRRLLAPLLDDTLGCATKGKNLVSYLVSNAFHMRFRRVWPYYSKSEGPIILKQVAMGYMPEAPECSAARDLSRFGRR